MKEKFPSYATRAPFYEAVCAYAEQGPRPYHTPGHKRGQGAHAFLHTFLTPTGLAGEVSLLEGLDDLYNSTTFLREAQQRAAKLWDADAAYFMVNGTTEAIHAMLLGTLSPGDSILLPRNAHRSLTGGAILAGLRPIFLEPTIDKHFGIAQGLAVQTVFKALQAHPEVKALVLVSPTYYGVASDLERMAKLLHAQGKLLLVDEAHGAHLSFSTALPLSAMRAGADMAASSTHKTLGALTQSSMLFLKTKRVSPTRVAKALSLIGTTSPNNLLLASLDIARLQMETEGRERVGHAVQLAQKIRRALTQIAGLEVMGKESLDEQGAFALDETKITVNVSNWGITGWEAENALRTQGIAAELADARNVLFIISYADGDAQAGALVKAWQTLATKYSGNQNAQQAPATLPMLPPLPPQALDLRTAFFAPSRAVRLEQAKGEVSAESLVFYPPGIPVIVPGEVFTSEILAYIQVSVASGAHVSGAADASLQTVRIIDRGNREEER